MLQAICSCHALSRRALLGAAVGVGALSLAGHVAAAIPELYVSGDGCNADNTPVPAGWYPRSAPRPELVVALRHVLNAAGIPGAQFDLYETTRPEILFRVQQQSGQRVILANTSFVSKLFRKDVSLVVCLLAHEVGHVVLNHVFGDEYRDSWSEAAADRFAGAILGRLPSAYVGNPGLASEAFEGLTWGGRYAKPSHRMVHFELGAINEKLGNPSSDIVEDFKVFLDLRQQISRGVARNSDRWGVLSDVHLVALDACTYGGSVWLETKWAVGFVLNNAVTFRIVRARTQIDIQTQRFRTDRPMKLLSKTYRSADEAFFSEAAWTETAANLSGDDGNKPPRACPGPHGFD